MIIEEGHHSHSTTQYAATEVIQILRCDIMTNTVASAWLTFNGTDGNNDQINLQLSSTGEKCFLLPGNDLMI